MPANSLKHEGRSNPLDIMHVNRVVASMLKTMFLVGLAVGREMEKQ